MDPPGTLFYLFPIPGNKYSRAVVEDPRNSHRACVAPGLSHTTPVLRVGLDQNLKSPPALLRCGRKSHNDVILNTRFNRVDQCYFDFNKETGELLLHDTSPNNDTDLRRVTVLPGIQQELVMGDSLMWKTPRQCAIVLSPDPYRNPEVPAVGRQWYFRMYNAEFLIIPPKWPSNEEQAALSAKRLELACMTDPDKTEESTREKLMTLGLQSAKSLGIATSYQTALTITQGRHHRYNTRSKGRGELELGKVKEQEETIRYIKIGKLGGGAQGEVHKVVDLHTGQYHACKVVMVLTMGTHSPEERKEKIRKEVNLVTKLNHPHIVPYLHSQGFGEGSLEVEIFMPIYEGDLDHLLSGIRDQGAEAVRAVTNVMLVQILRALDFLHTQDPPTIHRDLKPPNILYQGNRFLLTDFGIAKVVDTSSTHIGTHWFMAPEVMERLEQTTKVDIWGLAVTVIDCLLGSKFVIDRRAHNVSIERWTEYLGTCINIHAPSLASMLTVDAARRPTAGDLLRIHAPEQSTNAVMQNVPPYAMMLGFGPLGPASQGDGTTAMSLAPGSPMDWTRDAVTWFSDQPAQRNDATVQQVQPDSRAIPPLLSPPFDLLHETARRRPVLPGPPSRGERQEGVLRRKRSVEYRHDPLARPAGVPTRKTKREPKRRS